MLELDNVIALGELDPSKVVLPKDEYLMKVLYVKKKNKICLGHAAGLSGKILRAYVAAGLNDDHAPFLLLSFISLPTIPELGFTNKGLVDVRNHCLLSTLL
jgi:adenine deaminase